MMERTGEKEFKLYSKDIKSEQTSRLNFFSYGPGTVACESTVK